MPAIKELIRRNLTVFGITERNARVFSLWEDCLTRVLVPAGPADKNQPAGRSPSQLLARIELLFIRSGIIHLRTDIPLFRQEIYLRKQELIAELNTRLGEDYIKDIVFGEGTNPARAESGTSSGTVKTKTVNKKQWNIK